MKRETLAELVPLEAMFNSKQPIEYKVMVLTSIFPGARYNKGYMNNAWHRVRINKS